MAGFLYFISDDQRPPSPDKLKAWGLAYAFPNISGEHRPVAGSSPNGHSGSVICDPSRHGSRAAGYHKDQQTWRKMPTVAGRPELWVGYWNDAKPGPGDLRRAQLIRGPKIQLADGNAWQIPVVRRYDNAGQRWESELPAYIDCDDAGRMVRGEPLEEYATLWGATAPLADQMFAKEAGEPTKEATEDEIMEAVVALLSANYAVSLPELALLRVLQESDVATIVMIACRYNELLGWIDSSQKKSGLLEASGTIT